MADSKRITTKPVIGIDGEKVTMGVIEWWNNEVAALRNDADALNEFYRQFSRTTSHTFRDESKSSIMNLEKIYAKIDYNDGHEKLGTLTRGYFAWYNGVRFGKVIWIPNLKEGFGLMDSTAWTAKQVGDRNGQNIRY